MTTYLAEIAGSFGTGDLMKILGWASALVLGILAALAPGAKKKWEAEALKRAHVTISSPLPTVHTKEKVELATTFDLRSHIDRTDKCFAEIRETFQNERTIAREAQGKVHARLDKVMDNQALSRGELNQINLNVQRLLDRGESKPPTRRS